ncbi:MAG: SPOR domain-containing protein [Bacteroidota bacterium]
MLHRQIVPKAGLKFSLRSFLSILSLSLFLALPAEKLFAQNAYYHLIAGSYDDFPSAKTYAETLKARNYNSLVLFPTLDSKNYRVSVYHSANKGDVQGYWTQLKKAGINAKSFWILTQQPVGATATAVGTAPQVRVADGSLRGAGTYHLISGSFQQYDKAEEAKAAMAAQGFNSNVLFPDSKDGSYRVSIYRSPNRKEVETYSSMLKKRGKNPGWILLDDGTVSSTSSVARVSNTSAVTTGGKIMLGPKGGSATSTAPASRVAVSNVTYHLIGGSYKNFNQANNFSESLKAKGFDTLIMFPEPGVSSAFRVSTYRSNDKAQVTAFQRNVEAQQLLKKTWVYEQR